MAALPFTGLRARLVLIVLVALLPVLGLALLTGIEERRAAGDRVRDDALLLARLAAAHPERPGDLYAAAGLRPQDAYAETDRRFRRTLAALAVAGLIAVLAAWAAGDLFVRRLVQARKGAVLEGGLDHVIAMDENGRVVELEALRTARDELQKRVEARTAELEDANARLVDWVEELQQRAQDMRLLNETGDHLQACHSVQEAYAVIAEYGGSLFPDEPGALFMLNSGHHLVECVAAWGTPPPPEEVFSPDDCWALRRGRPHVVEGAGSRLVCRHVGGPAPAAYVCVPLMAQSTALGVLHLLEAPRPGKPDSLGPHHALARRQLALTVADQVGLALSNLRLQESLRDQAIRDPLTGLFNRRYMEESLERELRRAQRRRMALGVIMIDIDHFKRFNDTFGHAAGDTLLRAIGALLQQHTRGEDISCRYGGEEFALILLEATADDTEQRALLLRAEAARLHVEYGHQPLGNITISAGIAVFPDHGFTVDALFKAADAALYRAKAGGRDRVAVATMVG